MPDPSPEQQSFTLQKAIDLAIQHHVAGELGKSEDIYQQILQTDPNRPDALHLLGVIAHQKGEKARAIELITKALLIKPDYAEAHSNLGLSLHELGRQGEAIASFEKAIDIKPDYAEAHYNLGNSLQDLGKPEEAVASYHKALDIKPDYAEVYYNLGLALQELEQLNEAVVSYRNAFAIKPDYAEAHYNLGAVLRKLGQHEEAFTSCRRAVALAPQSDMFWSGLATSLENLSFTSFDDNIWQILMQLLERPMISSSELNRPIISALRHHPDFAQILQLTNTKKSMVGVSYPKIADRLSKIPLLLMMLPLGPIYDLEIERMLTVLRHGMLVEKIEKKTKEKVFPFSAALALHCFTNEYVFPETEEENEAIEYLQQQTATLLEKGKRVSPATVVALGAYRSLFNYPWAQKLTEWEWADNVKSIIKQQIVEPQVERSLRNRIPCITPIHNKVSKAVREQFEENRWPLWIKTNIHQKSMPIGKILKGSPLYFDLGDYHSPEKPKILIPGCGTGQHALYAASRYLNGHVLAVDLSLNSLAYAKRKSQELGFSSIQYAQGDITELGKLQQRFDLIESIGVLHHLDDPLSGWQILVDLLGSGGVIKIGLYSQTARRHIIPWLSPGAEKKYTTSPEDIRQCRQDIIAMAGNGNLKMAGISASRNFFSSSGCRDLLFPAREHRFTLPQIEEALQTLKLKFLGFELRDQEILKQFRNSHPDMSAKTSLSRWHEFELKNPETFGGMYIFWCKKT